MSRPLIEIVDELTVSLHVARRGLIYEFSGNIRETLRNLRQEINNIRKEAGLGPSPVEPMWTEEEEEEEEA